MIFARVRAAAQRTSTRQQANKGAGTSTLQPGQHPMPSVCCPVCVAQCAACSSAPSRPAPSSVYSVPHPPSSSSTWPASQLPRPAPAPAPREGTLATSGTVRKRRYMAQQQAPPSPRPSNRHPSRRRVQPASSPAKKKTKCEQSCVGGSFLGRSARARVLSAARTPNHPPIVKRLLGPPPIQSSPPLLPLPYKFSHTKILPYKPHPRPRRNTTRLSCEYLAFAVHPSQAPGHQQSPHHASCPARNWLNSAVASCFCLIPSFIFALAALHPRRLPLHLWSRISALPLISTLSRFCCLIAQQRTLTQATRNEESEKISTSRPRLSLRKFVQSTKMVLTLSFLSFKSPLSNTWRLNCVFTARLLPHAELHLP